MLKHKAKRGIVFLMIFVLPLLYIAGYGMNVQAASTTPEYYLGNDKDLPSPPKGLPSIKFDDNEITGVVTKSDIEGIRTVTATFGVNNKEVSFESDTPVAYVFVKAGNGGYLYSYGSPVYSDSNLYSPKNQSNQGNQADISHVTFYFIPTPDPTPDPTDYWLLHG